MNEFRTCLSPELLCDLARDELSPQQCAELEEHLTHCDQCRLSIEQFDEDRDWPGEVCAALSSLSEPDREPVSHGRLSSLDAEDSLESLIAMLGPTDDPRMLGRIGAYEIVGVLGRGGMGVVFKGFDGALNRYVAIKMLLPHLATSGAARKRFSREAQAAAAVVNDHVMAIHSVAEWQRMPYLVMPYSRGSSLQKRLDEDGPLAVAEILRIAMQTAKGLAAAHAQGLVHRDVKPANILLDEGVERVTLTDFGLARAVDDISLTRVGVLAGTPQFMSPEQARGLAVDARSNLFSLGCVMFAMCAGHSPFRAESSYGVLRQITDSQPRCLREINPAIPDWLERIVLKLLSKSPDDRIASATEVASLLEQCLAHVQQPTTVELPTTIGGWALLPVLADDANRARSGQSAQPTRRSLGAMAAIAVSVASTFAIFAWLRTQPVPNESEPASRTTSHAASMETPSHPSLTHDPLLEWNATQTELDATTRMIEQLDADGRRDFEGLEEVDPNVPSRKETPKRKGSP